MAVMGVEQEIKDKARELGFDAAGITDVAPIGSEHVQRFEAWRQAGCAGRMEYMHRHLEKRYDPAQLRRGARSVIVVALNYKPQSAIRNSPQTVCEKPVPRGMGFQPMDHRQDADATKPHGQDARATSHTPSQGPVGRVAMYAQYEDYHLFLKDLLRELAGFICMKTGRQDRFKICVDSAPVAEKALAVRAGLGCIGKNHLLIHPQLGPQILLGELLTSVPLEPDRPAEGACHDCNRCIEACPTGALRPDGLLDATRCLSYRTQEQWNTGMMECWNDGVEATQHSTIPSFQYSHSSDWLFGCDECLRACPYYEKAPACANRRFRFYPERAKLNLHELLDWTPEIFETRLRDSPIRRLGLEGLQRNARRCLRTTKKTTIR
ncbi:MAG: DUF1730 domain-containing protein [Planctomycetes bacterium]|nr:DUF1730 domain-containing protein [Planctomycetota bacterium]